MTDADQAPPPPAAKKEDAPQRTPGAKPVDPPRSRRWSIPWEKVFAVVGLLSGSFMAVLIKDGIPWESDLTYSFERDETWLPQQDDIVQNDYTRTTITIPSAEKGVNLEAWFYEPLPANPASPPPVVIMSHGLGCQKDMGLHPYAEQFAQAGLAVVALDYRTFGGSDGATRHWVSWFRHQEDVQSVVDFVAAGSLGRRSVNTSQIALWGVSYSGGLALLVAAESKNHDKIKAVVANEPYLSGPDGGIAKVVEERGWKTVARLLLAAVIDKLREGLQGGPIYLRLIAPHGTLAVLNVDEEDLQYSASAQKDPPPRIGGWQNKVTARMLIDNLNYKPIKHVHKIQAPVLLVAGSADKITPLSRIEQAKEILGDRAELLVRPYGHIEMHRRMSSPEELAPVIEFLRTRLQLTPPHVDTQPHETPAELEAQAPEVV